eukprot:m.16049 g.16049  ORF g.16049 m.16049 type:complete len:67 (+) comp6901_c0_seq1:70-270(+)
MHRIELSCHGFAFDVFPSTWSIFVRLAHAVYNCCHLCLNGSLFLSPSLPLLFDVAYTLSSVVPVSI